LPASSAKSSVPFKAESRVADPARGGDIPLYAATKSAAHASTATIAESAQAAAPSSQAPTLDDLLESANIFDFLEYAYLQSGKYSQAAGIAAEAKTVKESDVDPRFPNYYAIVEARYPVLLAIETEDWNMAANLKLQGPNWFTHAQGLLAHAVAAGHLHDPEGGKAAGEALEASVAPYPQFRAVGQRNIAR
jgi:hypothetical protein